METYFGLYFWTFTQCAWKIKMIFKNWYCHQFINTYAWIYAAIFFFVWTLKRMSVSDSFNPVLYFFCFFSPSTLWMFYNNGILLGTFSQSLKSYHPRKTMFASQIDSWFMQQTQTKTPLNIHAFIGGIDFLPQNNRASRLRKYIFMVSELLVQGIWIW